MAVLTRRTFVGAACGAAAAAATGRAKARSTDLAALYSGADGTELAARVRSGEVSALELLNEALRRVDQLNPEINAVTQRHDELARQLIRTGQLGDGPFAGVPLLLKDLGIQLAGTVTTGGSRILAGIKAAQDDILASRYKKAGFVPFGKTNTPEFGMALTTEPYLFGPCRNPWNLDHSTGGSSGGSAAAVAAGIVPIAHATDGGGSIRVPAAACGVFGHKPTRALTPRRVGPSMMSVSHVVSRSVRDSAAVLDLTAGYAPGLPFVSPEPVGGYLDAVKRGPGRLRIALVTDEPPLAVHNDVAAALRRVAGTLEDLKHTVEPASPGVDFDALNEAQTTLMLSEFSRGMKDLAKAVSRPLNGETLERLSLAFVASGERISAADYIAAWNHIQSVGASLAAFFQRYDLILSPVTVAPPPRLGVINEQADDDVDSFVDRFRTWSAYTPLQNLTGLPAASLPVSLSAEGLPVAVMLSAALGHDARVLAVSGQLEQALPFETRRPPVFAR
ncbi:MAG: amidase [Pseudomonadota bacterium]